MNRYLILIEKTDTGYSAHSPDVPGCLATGLTLEEIRENMKQAIEFHIEGLKQESARVPTPSTTSEYIDIAA